jgi:hypothetical protein
MSYPNHLRKKSMMPVIIYQSEQTNTGSCIVLVANQSNQNRYYTGCCELW